MEDGCEYCPSWELIREEPLLTSFAVNEARALRIAEIMTEFQSLQRRIAEYSPNHSPDEYFEEGYEVLRQCRAEAQAVLVAPYPVELSDASSISGDSEKRHLQRYLRIHLPFPLTRA